MFGWEDQTEVKSLALSRTETLRSLFGDKSVSHNGENDVDDF